MNILRTMTWAACLVLAELFRAGVVCCWGTPARALPLQSLCSVPSSAPACAVCCWAYILNELSVCQEASLILQLHLQLLAVAIKREFETTHRPLRQGTVLRSDSHLLHSPSFPLFSVPAREWALHC